MWFRRGESLAVQSQTHSLVGWGVQRVGVVFSIQASFLCQAPECQVDHFLSGAAVAVVFRVAVKQRLGSRLNRLVVTQIDRVAAVIIIVALVLLEAKLAGVQGARTNKGDLLRGLEFFLVDVGGRWGWL